MIYGVNREMGWAIPTMFIDGQWRPIGVAQSVELIEFDMYKIGDKFYHCMTTPQPQGMVIVEEGWRDR